MEGENVPDIEGEKGCQRNWGILVEVRRHCEEIAVGTLLSWSTIMSDCNSQWLNKKIKKYLKKEALSTVTDEVK